MAVIILCSAAAAPGTTTTALGLTLQWPRPALLADCDRDASQAITGGFLGGHNASRGLMSVLHATRRQTSIREHLLDHTHRLDACGDKLLLPGFTQPSASSIFSAWATVAEEFAHLHHDGRDVLIDAGRVGPTGLPADLVRHADLVVLVTRSSLRSLAAVSVHLPALLDQVELTSAACEVALGVVGPGKPYSVAEIGAQFGQRVVVQVPWAPEHAAVLSDAEHPPRRFESGTYVKGLVSAAGTLHQWVHHRLTHREAGVA